MRGHIRKHGKGWAVIIDEGGQLARHCSAVPRCRGVRVWAQDDAKADKCPRCGAPLGDAVKKRRQRWESFLTKKEAEAALTQILGKVAENQYVPPTKMTVGEYLRETWLPHLEDRVAMTKAGATTGGLRETTVKQYRTLVDTHIIDHIGDVPLRSLSAVRLDRMYGDLLRTGRKVKPGKPSAGLSPTTVHAIHVTVSAALTHAVKKGVLSHNVAAKTDPPGRAEREQAIWTVEETSRFLNATKDDRLAPMYLLAMASGLRRGELAGLRWKDIDLDAGKLTVASARVVVGYAVIESGPKTAKGRRTIALSARVVEALKAHRRQEGERAFGLVFTKEDGSPYHPQYLTWSFQRAAKLAGLRVLPLHALRHAHATAGLRTGVDLTTMSRRLGHSSTSITSDIYTHVVEELDQEAADRTEDQLFAPGRPG